MKTELFDKRAVPLLSSSVDYSMTDLEAIVMTLTYKRISEKTPSRSYPKDKDDEDLPPYGSGYFRDAEREGYKNKQSSNIKPCTANRTNELDTYGIVTKKDWYQWLLVNHPDKGGDLKTCQDVIDAGRKAGW